LLIATAFCYVLGLGLGLGWGLDLGLMSVLREARYFDGACVLLVMPFTPATDIVMRAVAPRSTFGF